MTVPQNRIDTRTLRILKKQEEITQEMNKTIQHWDTFDADADIEDKQEILQDTPYSSVPLYKDEPRLIQ